MALSLHVVPSPFDPPAFASSPFDASSFDPLAAFSRPVAPARANPSASTSASRLTLADRLLTAAQEADNAGHPRLARELLEMVYSVLDPDEDAPPPPASRARPVGKPAGKAAQLGRARRAHGLPCQTEA